MQRGPTDWSGPVMMVPGQPETYGISKRLPDDERKRLRRILEGVKPADAGLIVRTAAEGAAAEELERDVQRLAEQWKQISDLAARSKPGASRRPSCCSGCRRSSPC